MGENLENYVSIHYIKGACLLASDSYLLNSSMKAGRSQLDHWSVGELLELACFRRYVGQNVVNSG